MNTTVPDRSGRRSARRRCRRHPGAAALAADGLQADRAGADPGRGDRRHRRADRHDARRRQGGLRLALAGDRQLLHQGLRAGRTRPLRRVVGRDDLRRLPVAAGAAGLLLVWWCALMLLVTQLQIGAMIAGIGQAAHLILPGISERLAAAIGPRGSPRAALGGARDRPDGRLAGDGQLSPDRAVHDGPGRRLHGDDGALRRLAAGGRGDPMGRPGQGPLVPDPEGPRGHHGGPGDVRHHRGRGDGTAELPLLVPGEGIRPVGRPRDDSAEPGRSGPEGGSGSCSSTPG